MQFDVGIIVEGKVTGITKFGAFVELEEGTTGMVHISEVASAYVNEISEFLTVGQKVKVKVLKLDGSKISLSIKQAQENKTHSSYSRDNSRSGPRSNRKDTRPSANKWDGPKKEEYGAKKSDSASFEDMMSKFMKSSEEKMTDIRKNVDGKRGSYFRRSTTKSK